MYTWASVESPKNDLPKEKNSPLHRENGSQHKRKSFQKEKKDPLHREKTPPPNEEKKCPHLYLFYQEGENAYPPPPPPPPLKASMDVDHVLHKM